MTTEQISSIENGPFEFTSIFQRNRSKYLTLLTIRDGQTGVRSNADLLFLAFNSPVPLATLTSHLRTWEKWYYIEEVGDRYFLRPGGLRLILRLEKKLPVISNTWRTDLYRWRGLDFSCLKTPDGLNWLAKKEIMEKLESMKAHRAGTVRKGSKAGRPANPAPGPVPEAPQSTVAPAPAATAPKVQEPETVGIPLPKCPQCHKTLDFGFNNHWYCATCDISFGPAGELIKGKR